LRFIFVHSKGNDVLKEIIVPLQPLRTVLVE